MKYDDEIVVWLKMHRLHITVVTGINEILSRLMSCFEFGREQSIELNEKWRILLYTKCYDVN